MELWDETDEILPYKMKDDLEQADEILGYADESRRKLKFFIAAEGSAGRLDFDSQNMIRIREQGLNVLRNGQYFLDIQNGGGYGDDAVSAMRIRTDNAFAEFKQETQNAMEVIKKAEKKYNQCEAEYHNILKQYRRSFNEKANA
jgi:hypothetical protein